MFYVFKGEDFKAVLRFIRRAGGAVWLIGLLLVTAFILCESLIIYYLMKNLKQKPKLIAFAACILCGVFLQPRYADGVRRTADAACLYGQG